MDAVGQRGVAPNDLEARRRDPLTLCSIGLSRKVFSALTIYGKPRREIPCDCERSNEPSLLETQSTLQSSFESFGMRNEWLKDAGSSRRSSPANGWWPRPGSDSGVDPRGVPARPSASRPLDAELARVTQLAVEDNDRPRCAERSALGVGEFQGVPGQPLRRAGGVSPRSFLGEPGASALGVSFWRAGGVSPRSLMASRGRQPSESLASRGRQPSESPGEPGASALGVCWRAGGVSPRSLRGLTPPARPYVAILSGTVLDPIEPVTA